jgi:hypothetical protein
MIIKIITVNEYIIKSNKNVPNQYGNTLHPITFKAYFNFSSLSFTGVPINIEELLA